MGSWPKQGAWKGEGRNATRESHSHSWECGRVWGNEPTHSQMISHFGSWNPKDTSIFKKWFEGQNSLDWKIIYTIGSLLRCRCLKWSCRIYLSTYKTQVMVKKKRWESKCQFGSQPLKVNNCLKLHVYRGMSHIFGKILTRGTTLL